MNVDDITAHPAHTDIALYRLDVSSITRPLRTLRLAFCPPAKGEPCVAFGYTHADAAGHAIKLGSLSNLANDRPVLHASGGEVIDHYAKAGICQFPCFQIDGQVKHQMSGGPILSAGEDGRLAVRGVAASGYNVPTGANPLAFGSQIYPAAALDAVNPMNGNGEFVLDAARAGLVRALDVDHVDLDTSNPPAVVVGLAGC